MKNKGTIITLTVIIALLCIYYLSFTLVSSNINNNATEYAKDSTGVVVQEKKRAFLDSIRDQPVFNLLFVDYTLEDVNENKLNLGLDLQGGMHVVLEVSPVDIIKGLSGGSEDPDFLRALDLAQQKQKASQQPFAELFYQSWQEIAPNRPLNTVFLTAANRERINSGSSNDVVMRMVRTEVESAVERTFNILRSRIDKFGTTSPNIQRLQGTGRIQIELPGADDPERVRRMLQRVAKLEFWEVYELNEIYPMLQAIDARLVQELKLHSNNGTGSSAQQSDDLAELLSAEEAQSPVDSDTANDLAEMLEGEDSASVDSLQSTSVSPLFSLIRGQGGLYYSVRDTARINSLINREDIQGIMRNLKFLWSNETIESDGASIVELIPIRVTRGGRAPLTGEVITDARQDFDQAARPSISMQMNSEGARTWQRLTAQNIGKRIAVVLDNYVYSAPTVQNEIPNGNSQITGAFTVEEAQDLANILKAGSLPARARIVEEVIVGPTLGQEAQAQGILSVVAGLGLVLVFMFAYYSKGGLVANIALVFNIFFILGILAQIKAALTLPGIAGIVLTMGMSVDANVLIFERIREERRNGASLLQSISRGYSKAYSSIIDGNLTTLITAIFLFIFGLGPIRGFATTLIIGILSSLFTAVLITRVIVTWMTKKGEDSKLSFSTPFTDKLFSNLNFNFLGNRKKAYAFSTIFIGFGLALLIFGEGLNFGVDFKGGRSYVVQFSEPVAASDLKVALTDDFEDAGTEVKTYGANNVLRVTTSYLVDDESEEGDVKVQQALVSGVQEMTNKQLTLDPGGVDDNSFAIVSSSKVGATIADDIKNSSIEAIIFSLLGIFAYILIRFKKWQFSLGAVSALMHDTLAVISAFAIAQLFGKSFEVDQVFIAAILTIIGYSINDTVIIFDRIRENLAERPQSTLEKTFNVALNDTLSRTLVTSGTTLLVVTVLLLFGGEVLRGFSFALFVGVLIGTYSSIFIATPVVIDLQKKELAKAVAQTTKLKDRSKARV